MDGGEGVALMENAVSPYFADAIHRDEVVSI